MLSYSTRRLFVKKIILVFVLLVGVVALFTPTLVAVDAQTTDVCQTFGQNCGTITSGTNSNAIVNVVANVTNWLVVIGVAIGIFFVVYGAFRMIASIGAPEAFKSGLNTITNAILGIIILLLAYTIVSWIVGLVGGLK